MLWSAEEGVLDGRGGDAPDAAGTRTGGIFGATSVAVRVARTTASATPGSPLYGGHGGRLHLVNVEFEIV